MKRRYSIIKKKKKSLLLVSLFDGGMPHARGVERLLFPDMESKRQTFQQLKDIITPDK